VSVLLLPSPLLPAQAYGPLVAALARSHPDVTAADGADARSGWQLVSRWARRMDGVDLVVAHSNAGYLAPAVRAAARSDAALVLLDAALPPTRGLTRLAPEGLRAWLGSMTLDDQGRLPPWTRWWEPGALRGVVPAALLDDLDAVCPPVPLAYLDSVVAAPAGWTRRRNGYVVLSQAYQAEQDAALGHGWPVRRLSGTHLQHLWDPEGVAAAVGQVAAALGA
jgi:hypothetical protein